MTACASPQATTPNGSMTDCDRRMSLTEGANASNRLFNFATGPVTDRQDSLSTKPHHPQFGAIGAVACTTTTPAHVDKNSSTAAMIDVEIATGSPTPSTLISIPRSSNHCSSGAVC